MPSIITGALMGILLLSGQQFGSTKDNLLGTDQLPTYTVTVTGYNAVPGQTDSTPDITASGAFSNPEIIAARSVDLADELPFGSVIEVDSDSATSSNSCGIGLVDHNIGLRVIADSMHPRMKQRIDILLPEGTKTNPARTLGVCKDVGIKVVGHVDINHMPATQAELQRVVVAQNLAIAKK